MMQRSFPKLPELLSRRAKKSSVGPGYNFLHTTFRDADVGEHCQTILKAHHSFAALWPVEFPQTRGSETL